MQNGNAQQVPQAQLPHIQPHQGVLWKRRDVFKNRWRPRWFCLQANQGVLTYYLLTAPPTPITANFNNAPTTTTTHSSSSPIRSNSHNNTPTRSTSTIGRVMSGAAAATRSSCYGTSTTDADDSENYEEILALQQQQRDLIFGPGVPPMRTVISSHANNDHDNVQYQYRNRTISWDDSQISENTVDYDVVPRGSIYLLDGCIVEINESLSKPREHLYAFTIKSPKRQENITTTTTTEIHLAARSAQARREWVEKLLNVCDSTATLQQGVTRAAASSPQVPLTVNLGGLAPRRQRSLPVQRVPSVAEMNEYHDENDNNAVDDAGSDFFQEALQQQEENETSTSWQSTSPTSSLYVNVPTDLAQDIQHRLDKYLPMIDNDDDNSSPLNNNNWTKLFERNGHEAYVTVLPNEQQSAPGATTTSTTPAPTATPTEGTAVVKTIAMFLEHSPRQVFNLLMDPSRRREYESDVRSTCRLKTYNPYTFLDLTTYNPIWPMSARELATVVHWQVMSKKKENKNKGNDDNENENDIERSLVLVAFSCPQAQALQQQPVESRNVIQAHLLLSLFVLRPMADYTATQMTRLVSLSLDPKVGGFCPVDLSASGSGSSGQRLQKFVLGQMAGLSTVMAGYLQRHEPLPPSGRLTGPLDNDLIIRDIIQHLPDSIQRNASSSSFKTAAQVDGQSQQDDADGISRDDNDDDDDSGRWDRSIAPLTGVSRSSSHIRPALERQATILLAPVLLFQLLQWNNSDLLPGRRSFALVLFCIVAFYAVRLVVLWHVENIYPSSRKTTTMMPIWENTCNDTCNRVLGPTTIRFTIDLKGILRFITNKKEDREELGQGTAEVSVIHLVASALARALKKEASLRQRRVALPWLWIDKVIDASSVPIRVSISENGGRWLTLDHVDSRPVQDIADDLAEQEQEERQFRLTVQRSASSSKSLIATTQRRQPVLGECLVLATPDMDQSDPDTDFNVSVIPSQAQANHVAVVAVIGGVKLEHHGGRNSGAGGGSTMQHASNGSIAGSTAPAPRPILTLTLTISGPLQQDTATTADFVTCRRFAEDVKILLQFPEMCE